MVENQLIVDGSTCKPSTRKPATSSHPAFALLLLAGTLLLLALAFLPQPALAATPITTCTELQNIRNGLAGDYYLANDIDCSGIANFKPIGTSSSKFTGTFDGKGYKITNMYINRPSTNYVGLFGYTATGSEIKDVGLEEVNVSGKRYVGGLVGVNMGPITNSYSSGSVSGYSHVGGLVGYNYGPITNSYSSGSVSGSSRVGGLVGFVNLGTITNSYSSGSVSGDSYVGGLVGFVNLGTITNSYSSGSVSGSSRVGGLVGRNDGTITNSYSSGSVSGSSRVGGLVGLNYGTITNSYWDIYRSGRSNCVGSDSGTTNCTGKNNDNSEPYYWYYSTHPPMNNWDFDNIWGIQEGVTYPYLRWQYAPKITSFAPPSPVYDTVCNWRTFNVTVNQTVNVSWYLNDSLLHTNESVRDASCRLHADAAGVHNVTAIAVNAKGSDMQTWVWVTAGLNCTCGNICVNETGWWRDGGAFIASGTPIQDAIDNATAGNTICVKDGTYHENVDVTKSDLTIRSEHGPSVTTVSASLYPDKHVFKITDQTNVTLEGFEIRDAHGTSQDVAGIYMYKASECNIFDNIVTNISANNHAYGIYLSSSSDNSFVTTTVYNLSANYDAYGISLDSSSDNSFVTTTVYNLSSANYDACGIYLYSSSDNNSFVTSTVYNLSANYDAYGISLDSSSDNSFVTTTVYNLSADDYAAYGIYLSSSSDDNSFSSGSISDIKAPTWWDFYSAASSHGNSAEDITISSFPTTISFTYENGIELKSVQTPPADPAGKRNISKYVHAVEVTANSWIFMNVNYEEGDLGGVDENSLRLWKHNGTDWTEVPGTNGVNTAENYVYANITEFSVFAPLGNVTGAKLEINKTGVPDPVSPGGTLNYTICVNNTGNATATNVTVTETYDGNVTFVSAVPAPSLDNDTWKFATLNASETRWVNISVIVNASVLNGTVLHNVVNVMCDEGVSDSDTENTTVLAPVLNCTCGDICVNTTGWW
jgi:uncharacterized repeat protein (TIGR01451 family)